MAAAPIESLRPDTPLKPLYIIHGEEDLLRIEALDTLRAAAKNKVISTAKSIPPKTILTGTSCCKAPAAQVCLPI